MMAAVNLRGPWASLLLTPLRISWDQMLENATGIGAPPWTWPGDEIAIDVLHKTVFALTTGFAADRMIPPPRGAWATRSDGTPAQQTSPRRFAISRRRGRLAGRRVTA
jgi:hypothetical protein